MKKNLSIFKIIFYILKVNKIIVNLWRNNIKLSIFVIHAPRIFRAGHVFTAYQKTRSPGR